MKTFFSKAQWWRSPPALVLSVVAAAALLFFSGRAALKAFAEGEEERTFVLQYVTDDPDFSTGMTYGSFPASIVTATVTDSSRIYIITSNEPSKDKYDFRAWNVMDNTTGSGYLNSDISSIPVSFFRQVGDTNTYVTTATAVFHRPLRVKFDVDTDDTVSWRPDDRDFYDSEIHDGYGLPVGTSITRRGYWLKNWRIGADGTEEYENLLPEQFTESTWDSTANRYVLSVYANWIKQPVITYHSNLPDYAGEQLTATELANVGSTTMINHASGIWSGSAEWEIINNATKAHTLQYWRDQDGTLYEPYEYYTIEKDLDLEALWSRECYLIYERQAAYDSNGNMPKNERFYYLLDGSQEIPSHTLSPLIPYRYGATFTGWSTDPEGTHKLNGSIPISAFPYYEPGNEYRTTVYANWNVKNVDFRYFSNLPEGSVIEDFPENSSIPYAGYDSMYVSSVTPSAPGYTFRGWRAVHVKTDGEKDTYGYLVDPGNNFTQLMDEDDHIEFYAVWRTNYTVFYNPNVEEGIVVDDHMNNSLPKSSDFTDGNMADGVYTINSSGNLHSAYYREDDSEGHSYSFMGWSRDNLNDVSHVTPTLVHSDFTLNPDTRRFETTIYCTWQRQTEIVYHSINDQNISEYEGNPIITVFKGDPTIADHTVKDCEFNATLYHTFLCWTTEEDGSGTQYQPGDRITTDTDVHLYAQVNRRFVISYNATAPYVGNSSEVSQSYQSFEMNVNDITDESSVYDISTSDLLTPDASLTGAQDRYFLGWSLKENGTLEDVISKGNRLYLSSFRKAQGYAVEQTAGRYYVNLYSVWSTKPYCVEYAPNIPTEDPIITVFPENASSISYRQVLAGYPLSSVVPVVKGYTFRHYDVYYDGFVYGSRTGSPGLLFPGHKLVYEMFLSDSQKVVNKARWYQKRRIIFAPNVDDGTTTLEQFTYEYVQNDITDTDANNPSYLLNYNNQRFAHSFDGWSYNSDGSEEVGSSVPFDRFSINEDSDYFEARLYAKWSRGYHLDYDMNFGEDDTVYIGISPGYYYGYISTTVRDYQLTDQEPTRPGYTFKGWGLTPDATDALADNKIPLNLTTFTLNREREYYEATVYALWEPNEHTVSYALEYADDVNAADVGVAAPTSQSHSYREENIAVAAAPSGYDTAAYTFSGWNTADVTVTGGKFTMPDKNVVFKGKFTRNVRTVTYRAGEGEGSDITESFTSGSTTSVKPANTFLPPAGKEFDRWVCDTQGYSTTPGDDITVNDNVVYTALWKNVFYTLQYDKGEVPAITGTLPATVSDITWADLRAGEVFISETEIHSDGYTFTGWKITNGDDDSIFKIYDASKFGSLSSTEQLVNEALFDGTRNATAVAQWKHNYTVTYNVSGIPSGFDYPATQSDSYAEGTKVSLKAKPIGYDDDHYEFIGWDSEDIDTDQSSFTVDRHIVITGKFRAKAVPPQPVTYTVTYQSGGDSPEEYTDTDISGDYTLLDISDVGFTVPEGMGFDRWVLVTPDDKEYPENANAGAGINVISDVTYQAVWSSSSPAFPSATITYTSGLTEDYPGYNESCSTPFVINDVPTTAEYSVLGNDPNHSENPSFAPDGYEFAGWKPISRTSGASPRSTPISGGAGADGLYHEGDTIAADDLKSGSVTLQAMWKVTLTYDANGGTGSLPENGEPIPVLVDGTETAASGGSLTRSGARFDHWNTKPNDNGTKYQPGHNLVMKNNTVLYAIYTDSPDDDTGSGEPDGTTFTVIYKPNGGTGNVPKDDKQYSAGATVAVASKGHLVRTGCTFKEWNTKPDGSGTGYKGDGSDSFVISADTTLYAVWVDGSGKIIPSPGTGESSLPMIIAVNAALLSLAALVFMAARERRKSAENC